MEDLIKEYRESLRMLRNAKATPLHAGSMISDTEFAIELMETGHIPGTKWAVARWPVAKREVPVDPLEMARYIRNRAPASAAPEWMVKILDKLLSFLTERERDAYTLVRGNGYSFAQAAKLMKCTKASAQVYVRRAEEKIRLVIRKQTISREVI
ncbi:MAG: hypothetical protein K6U74_01070 [Firmicutes bacterium]|nr:hypothetical protein [Bacillota bacterium]